jgi:hypothetical protein
MSERSRALDEREAAVSKREADLEVKIRNACTRSAKSKKSNLARRIRSQNERDEAARKDEAETVRDLTEVRDNIQAHRAKRARRSEGNDVTSSSEEEDPPTEEHLAFQEDQFQDALDGIALSRRARGEDPKTGERTVKVPESP